MLDRLWWYNRVDMTSLEEITGGHLHFWAALVSGFCRDPFSGSHHSHQLSMALGTIDYPFPEPRLGCEMPCHPGFRSPPFFRLGPSPCTQCLQSSEDCSWDALFSVYPFITTLELCPLPRPEQRAPSRLPEGHMQLSPCQTQETPSSCWIS